MEIYKYQCFRGKLFLDIRPLDMKTYLSSVVLGFNTNIKTYLTFSKKLNTVFLP